MANPRILGQFKPYIPNTQADRASRHWANQIQKKQAKGDLFQKMLKKKMEAGN